MKNDNIKKRVRNLVPLDPKVTPVDKIIDDILEKANNICPEDCVECEYEKEFINQAYLKEKYAEIFSSPIKTDFVERNRLHNKNDDYKKNYYAEKISKVWQEGFADAEEKRKFIDEIGVVFMQAKNNPTQKELDDLAAKFDELCLKICQQKITQYETDRRYEILCEMNNAKS
jgi:hypothetical protein